MSRKANAELLKEFQRNPTFETYEAVAGGIPLPATIGDPKYQVPEGKEIISAPGILNRIRGKKIIVDKDRPKGVFRLAAQLRDTLSGQKTDFDKLGGRIDEKTGAYDQFAGVTQVTDDLEKKFSPVQAKRIEKYLKAELEEPKTALEEAEEGLEFYEKNFDRISGLNRKLRRDAAIDAQLNYMATEPIRQAFANRAAEAAAQRGLRIRAAKEAMPSNIQNIMLSKQAQAATASSAEAERARAAADQQDAATRFAGLGMQRRFG